MNNSQRIFRVVPYLSAPGAAVLCLAIGMWLLGKPYRAFEHDAVYYMADALARAGWADFSKDLFFRYGSQGEFSPLMAPYALLVKALGVHASAWDVTVVGKLAWLVAGWCLARALAPTKGHARVALAAVLILPSYYGLGNVFSHGESFATPRLISEAAALAGLAGIVSGRWWLGMTLTVFSFVAHPLMGAPVCAVALMMSPPRRADLGPSGVSWGRVAIVLVAGVVLALVGAQWGLRPLDRLWQHYDQAWWDVVLIRNDYAVSQTLGVDDGLLLAAQCAFLGLAAIANPPRSMARPLAVVVLVVLIVALLAWFWGCTVRNALLVQVQPWRVLWLAQWLTPVLWCVALLAGPRASHPSDLTLGALVTAGLLASPVGMAVLACLVALLVLVPRQLERHVSSQRQRVLAFSIMGVLLLLRLISLPDSASIIASSMEVQHPWWQAMAEEPAVGVAIGWAWLCLPSRWIESDRITAGLMAGAMVFTAGCAAVWLQEGKRKVHAEAPWAAELRERLPDGSVVYSNEPFAELWLDLRRPLYAHTGQGASVLFNRDQALELNRRLLKLRDLGLSHWPANSAGQVPFLRLDAATIHALCQQPEIDVVLSRGGGPSASYHVTTSFGEAMAVFECRGAGQDEKNRGKGVNP